MDAATPDAGDDWIEIDDGDVTWRLDGAFMRSNWTCIWGRGCQGILDHPAPELHQGCCSIGADLDEGDALDVAALAQVLDPGVWQYHETGRRDGVIVEMSEGDRTRRNTRVVDGACVFLNRPGFDGGAGCALHLAALAEGESPLEWKPSVCWQLPLRVDWRDRGDGGEVATVRGWRRADWGDEGEQMAWVCTEAPEAYVGDRPVVESLADELRAITGDTVFVELRRRSS